jgi:hypothetical protein
MENSSAFWPVAVQTTGFQEAIAFFKQEVVVDQLLLLLRGH